MKKRLLSVLLCLCLVLALLPTLALAAATGIQVTDATYHANGNLASITAKFGWSTAAANSRLVLMTEKLNDGDLTNQGTYGDDFQEWTDVEAAKSTLGIISMSDVASVSGAQNSLSISFGENDIPLNTDKTYYVYLWTRWGQWSGDESCYPDNLISVIKVEGGTVQYTGATGSNSHGDSYQEVPYTVTFDLQGHGTAISEQTVVKGGKVTAPTAPTDSDYDFGGWFKEAACTTAWNFDTDTVTATTTLYAKWTETPKALEEVTFGYAYDVQRNPSFPDGVGDTVTLSSLSRPLLAGGRDDRKDTNEGTWTLTKMGTYSYVKTLGGTVSFTSEIASKYGVTADEIVVHELKDGTDHIAYGVVIVYDAENGYAVFIGNNISGSGAGYLLSTEAKSENFTITADQIATDFIPTCELALDTTGTYTFTAAADKTVTASNSGTAATGALTVALSGTNAASFELNKTAIADIATGGSDTFTVAPKSGLAAGTYTATVTVSGANVVAKSFDVTYTVSAPATPVTLLNDGYPYGKAMSSSSVTLVMDVSGTASSYQWQSADAKDGTYTDIADANAKELVLSSPTSGTWYRCVVNGALTSKAVQVVKPNTSGPDVNGNKWTASYGTYYISNGTVAYMVSGSRFDVTGLYVKDSTSYMLQTSYSENWQMFSSTQAAPDAFDCSGSTSSAVLDALRVAFDDADVCAVYFEADLAEGQQAFSFGADTQLGNSSTSGNYYDRAALIATVENSALKQVAMIGAASEADAKESDPAFVIAPNSLTPASKFWIGYYGDREAYGSSTDTKIEGGDSGMTMSWLNVTSGGSVNFIFKVGTAEATGAIRGDSIASPTGEVTLELPAAATNIEVKVGGTVLTAGTHYTIDTTNTLQPKIIFLPDAGLTHESVITVVVDGTSVPITNNIPAPVTTYTVTFDANGHGTPPAAQTVNSGAPAAEPAAPTASGCTFGGWYTDTECTTAYDFSTPVTGNITLYAKWTQIPVYIPPVYVHGCTSKCDVCGGCADLTCTEAVCAGKCRLLTMNFADVAAGEWYTEAVGYVYHHGMMQGPGNGLFNIDGSTSRAMIVTILWRLEGMPLVSTSVTFDDVAEGKWYTEAVKWAASNGIVTGYAGEFHPEDAITREQLAAILYRYAMYKGYDVSARSDLSVFSDADRVSPWAVEAVQWACGEGIITGKDGALVPQGSAKRSEAAAMLMRFCQAI